MMFVYAILQTIQTETATRLPEIYSVRENWRVTRQKQDCVMQSRNDEATGILFGYDSTSELVSLNFFHPVIEGREYQTEPKVTVVFLDRNTSAASGDYEFMAMTVNGTSLLQQVRISPRFLSLVARHDRIRFVWNGLVIGQFDLAGSAEAIVDLRDCADERANDAVAEPQ